MRAVIEEIEDANSGRSVESMESRVDIDVAFRESTSRKDDWQEEMLVRGLSREE